MARSLFVSLDDNTGLLACFEIYSCLTNEAIVEWFEAQGCSRIEIKELQ